MEEDLQNWCERQTEPPNYLLSILDRVRRHKELIDRRHNREEKEKFHKAITPEESYAQLIDFCNKFNIQPNKVLSSSKAKTLTRMKLIESLCLNVENSFLNYKRCGNVDDTLTKLKLLKPKMVEVSIKIDEKLQRETEELETLRKHKQEVEHRYLTQHNSSFDLSTSRIEPKHEKSQ